MSTIVWGVTSCIVVYRY